MYSQPSKMRSKDFTYLGWDISQQDGFDGVDQQEYGKTIELVVVRRCLKTTNEP